MLTQLLFEHSLRIRMVAEVANSGTRTPGTKTPKAATPGADAASVAEGTGSSSEQTDDSATHTAEGSNAQTLVASTASVSTKGKGKDKDDSKDKEKEKEADNSSNLVGKINNLMSTDLGNITEGRDFLFVILFAPVQIIVSIIFLYQILGWR